MPVAQESIPPAENVGPAQRKKKKNQYELGYLWQKWH